MAEQAGLSVSWSQTAKDKFSRDMVEMFHDFRLTLIGTLHFTVETSSHLSAVSVVLGGFSETDKVGI